jgi:hypothetical protein
MWRFAAALFGLSHLALIVLLIVGAPLSLIWNWMPKIHVPAAIATGAIFAVGADCPLTTWQKACIRRSGRQPYSGGFIEHYLVHPITGNGITATVKVVILLTWIVPSVVGYWLLARQRAHRLAPG